MASPPISVSLAESQPSPPRNGSGAVCRRERGLPVGAGRTRSTRCLTPGAQSTGRFERGSVDPLCKPAKKFWGLTGHRDQDVVSCHDCIKQALRLGIEFDARASLDLGRSWYAGFVVEGGRPQRVDLRSRWFRYPPGVPPEPPSEDRMLRAVQAIAPSVRAVHIDRLEPLGDHEIGGVALLEVGDGK